MTTAKPKSPEAYPYAFHYALERVKRGFIARRKTAYVVCMCDYETPEWAKIKQKSFREFRAALRLSPSHPLYTVERDYILRVSVIGTELHLTARKRADIAAISQQLKGM